MATSAPLGPDYRKWIRRPQWTLFEAVCLLTGMEPPKSYDQKFLVALLTDGLSADIYADLKGAISRGWIQSWPALTGGNHNHSMRVDPKECVCWVSNQGYQIPDALLNVTPQPFAVSNKREDIHAPAFGSDIPVSRQHAQEQAILNLLVEKGFDANHLPAQETGKAGVKKEIRLAAQKRRDLFQGTKTFDKAWERLLNNGDIRYSERLNR